MVVCNLYGTRKTTKKLTDKWKRLNVVSTTVWLHFVGNVIFCWYFCSILTLSTLYKNRNQGDVGSQCLFPSTELNGKRNSILCKRTLNPSQSFTEIVSLWNLPLFYLGFFFQTRKLTKLPVGENFFLVMLIVNYYQLRKLLFIRKVIEVIVKLIDTSLVIPFFIR